MNLMLSVIFQLLLWALSAQATPECGPFVSGEGTYYRPNYSARPIGVQELSNEEKIQIILSSLDKDPYRTGILVSVGERRFLGIGHIVDSHKIMLEEEIYQRFSFEDRKKMVFLWAGEMLGNSKNGFTKMNTTAGIYVRNPSFLTTANIENLKVQSKNQTISKLFSSNANYLTFEQDDGHLHPVLALVGQFRHDFINDASSIISALNLFKMSDEYLIRSGMPREMVVSLMAESLEKFDPVFKSLLEVNAPYAEMQRLSELIAKLNRDRDLPEDERNECYEKMSKFAMEARKPSQHFQLIEF